MKQFKEKKTARKCSHEVSENSSLQLFISSRSLSLSTSRLSPLHSPRRNWPSESQFKFAFCIFLQVGGCCCVFISLHVVLLYLCVYFPCRKIVVMLRLIRALQHVWVRFTFKPQRIGGRWWRAIVSRYVCTLGNPILALRTHCSADEDRNRVNTRNKWAINFYYLFPANFFPLALNIGGKVKIY